ncbi:MAG: HEAT repeat domain-containing protein [Planctomycetota bacterium]|jgi:HEAT repeat protein
MEFKKPTKAWIQDLCDERAPTRCTAAYELGKIGDHRAVMHLVKALKDGYFSVRQYAAESLGILGNKRAIEPLIAALEDDNLDLREAVAGALAKITNQFFSTSEEWYDWFDGVDARSDLP